MIASGPITSWEIDGETLETVTDFILLDSQITTEGDCHLQIKSCLLLNRKAVTNLDSILKKQRHYFAEKGPSSQSYGFSSSHVRMWETIKKAERWRTDAFELWCWRRCLRFPWTARRSNQSILKEINPGYSSEGLMLKLQYLDHLMGTANSLEKNWCWERLKAKCSRRGKQRMRRLNSITDSVDVSLSKLQEIVKDREASSASTHGVTKSWIWLSNWTTTKVFEQKYLPYRIKAIQIKTLFRYMRDYLH